MKTATSKTQIQARSLDQIAALKSADERKGALQHGSFGHGEWRTMESDTEGSRQPWINEKAARLWAQACSELDPQCEMDVYRTGDGSIEATYRGGVTK